MNRVARKLNIDCAQACTGFNFGCRGALPAFEGYVVCEEYEDTLREAWEEEQIESQKRAKEKREKRIYGNWKKLIKGLFIREKLAVKYNFKGETDNTHFEEDKRPKIANKKPAPETKSSEAVADHKEVCHSKSNTKSERSKNKATTTKKMIALVDESEEKKPVRNEKVDNIKKNFARRKAKTLKVSSDNDSNGEASGSGLMHDDLNANSNDRIRITRKRAAALKNLNVNEEDSEDECHKKAGTVPKRKLPEKKVDVSLKTSKKLKLEQDNSSKKIKR